MRKYYKPDISKIIGEPIRKIKNWTDFGLIRPDIVPAMGQGIEQVYSQVNLIEFGMIKILKNNHTFGLGLIREILSGLRLEIKKNSEIENFYTEEEWGREKELIYINSIPLSSKPEFKVIQKALFEMKPNPFLRVVVIIGLGAIRNEAIEKFKLIQH